MRAGGDLPFSPSKITVSAAMTSLEQVLIRWRDAASLRNTLRIVVLVAVAIANGIILALAPQAAKYILALTGVAGYIFLCLEWPFPAFIVLLFFALTVWLSGIKPVAGISMMIGIGAIFTLTWLARLVAGAAAFTRVKEYRLLLALAGVVLLSAMLHLDGPAGFSAVSTYVQLFLLCILVINLTTTPARLTAATTVVAVSSIFLAILICLDQLGWLPATVVFNQNVGMGFENSERIIRAAGLWGDANLTALQLTIALPFIFERWATANRPQQMLLLAAGGVVLTAFVWTFSLGGLLGLCAILLAKMFITPPHRRLFRIARNGLIGLILLLLFTTFAPASFLQRILLAVEKTVTAVQSSDKTLLLTLGTDRGDTWWAALQTIAAAPVFGYGPGNGVYANASYTRLHFDKWVSPHNMFLAIAGDLGLVGLALFGVLCGSALLMTWGKGDPATAVFNVARNRQAIFIALLGCIVQGMALEIHNLKLLWILLGLAIAARQITLAPGAEQPQ